MKLSMTYRVRTKGFNHIFNETVRLYRRAVSFFRGCMPERMEPYFYHSGTEDRSGFMESITRSKPNRIPLFSMTSRRNFSKFPSYLRRAAIAEALGKASSYRSNLTNWEAADPAKRGETVTAAGGIRVSGHVPFRYVHPYRDIQEALKGLYPQYLGLGSGRSQKE